MRGLRISWLIVGIGLVLFLKIPALPHMRKRKRKRSIRYPAEGAACFVTKDHDREDVVRRHI